MLGVIFDKNEHVSIKVRLGDASPYESVSIKITQKEIPQYLNIAVFDVDTREIIPGQLLSQKPKWEKRYKILVNDAFFTFDNIDVAKKYFKVLSNLETFKEEYFKDIHPELYI